MKLWQKISLLCSLILAFVVIGCTAIQLQQTRDTLYAVNYNRAHSKLLSLKTSFAEMVDYYGEETDSLAAEKALLHYCFSRFADSGTVLVADGKTIWSGSSIDPEIYCDWSDSSSSVTCWTEIDSRPMLIEGYSLELPRLDLLRCRIYVVEDFTPVEDVVREMVVKFLVIGLMGMILGLALVILLVRRSMKPLEKLQTAAAHIAQGSYSQRAEITTKDEIGNLAVNFNRMADSVEEKIMELTETAERQRLFIGAVTHEFKTPLTGILLNADNLQNTYMTEDEQMDALAAIETQGKWLERLVQQMLKLLTINREIKIEPFPVSVLLDRVTDSTRDILARREVKLDTQYSDSAIYGDIDLLQSALVNLIDNASKASQPGQTVSISAASDTIEVIDRGCGIPADAVTHITEAFYMADRSRSKKQGGVGLGLALVQEIVNAHGAVLQIESTQNAGTTMRILFER